MVNFKQNNDAIMHNAYSVGFNSCSMLRAQIDPSSEYCSYKLSRYKIELYTKRYWDKFASCTSACVLFLQHVSYAVHMKGPVPQHVH